MENGKNCECVEKRIHGTTMVIGGIAFFITVVVSTLIKTACQFNKQRITSSVSEMLSQPKSVPDQCAECQHIGPAMHREHGWYLPNDD